jgi:hypothetical protein
MRVTSKLVGVKESSSARPMTPEQELLLATLDRAVLDYYGSELRALGEAGDWLFGKSDPAIAFSFEWTCAYLEAEPAALRDRIRQLCIPRDVAQAHRWLRSKVQSRNKVTAATA